jgi:hypothetical protein
MRNGKDHENKILTHILGETTDKDRTEMEAELRTRPQDTADYERLVEGVRAWAKEPVDVPPLRFEDLEAAAKADAGSITRVHDVPRPARALRAWAWAMAAAALLLFALSQVSFQVRFGASELNWGKRTSLPANTNANLAQLSREIADCRKALEENAQRIQSVALQGQLFEQEARIATERLVRLQQAESQTRFQDVSKLIQMVSIAGQGTDERD